LDAAEKEEYLRLRLKAIPPALDPNAVEEMDRSLIEIFCDKDLSKMAATQIMFHFGDIDERVADAFKCLEFVCGRFFVDSQGYINILGGKVDRDGAVTHRCTGHPGTLAIVAIEDTRLGWGCVESSCQKASSITYFDR
jgi:hypothetical protein